MLFSECIYSEVSIIRPLRSYNRDFRVLTESNRYKSGDKKAIKHTSNNSFLRALCPVPLCSLLCNKQFVRMQNGLKLN